MTSGIFVCGYTLKENCFCEKCIRNSLDIQIHERINALELRIKILEESKK